MFDLGWSEIALVVALAFVVFGPQHIPEIVRSLYGFVRQCRRLYGRWRTHFDAALYDLEFQEGAHLEERLLKGTTPPHSSLSQDHPSKTGTDRASPDYVSPVDR